MNHYISGAWPLEVALIAADRLLPKRKQRQPRRPTTVDAAICLIEGGKDGSHISCTCLCYGVPRPSQVLMGATLLARARLSSRERARATTALCTHVLSGEFTDMHNCANAIKHALHTLRRADIVFDEMRKAQSGEHALCDPDCRLNVHPDRLEATLKDMLPGPIYRLWKGFNPPPSP